MSSVCMLSTYDNPYNPFEQFTLWSLFDIENGYNSAERLMRIAQTSPEMSQKEEDEEIERAIDEIIKYDDANIYIKVRKTDEIESTEAQ